MKALCVLVSLLLVFTSGCARVNPKPDYDRVSQRVGDVTGVAAPAVQGDPETAEARLASLAEKGFTADEAVQFALLNNPCIRAAFQRVGMSRADLVQAGLFTNPQVGFAFNFPTGGGANQFGVSLAQNIADLWMIPARRRAGRRDLDRCRRAARRRNSERSDHPGQRGRLDPARAASGAISTCRDGQSLDRPRPERKESRSRSRRLRRRR